jgi:hypothetical protein
MGRLLCFRFIIRFLKVHKTVFEMLFSKIEVSLVGWRKGGWRFFLVPRVFWIAKYRGAERPSRCKKHHCVRVKIELAPGLSHKRPGRAGDWTMSLLLQYTIIPCRKSQMRSIRSFSRKLPIEGWGGSCSIASVAFFHSATPPDADKSNVSALGVLSLDESTPVTVTVTQAAHSRLLQRKIRICHRIDN